MSSFDLDKALAKLREQFEGSEDPAMVRLPVFEAHLTDLHTRFEGLAEQTLTAQVYFDAKSRSAQGIVDSPAFTAVIAKTWIAAGNDTEGRTEEETVSYLKGLMQDHVAHCKRVRDDAASGDDGAERTYRMELMSELLGGMGPEGLLMIRAAATKKLTLGELVERNPAMFITP